jgi:hypothetical protein
MLPVNLVVRWHICLHSGLPDLSAFAGGGALGGGGNQDI